MKISAHESALKYLLWLPDDYTESEKYPLILFLHGSGECGDDLELVKLHGLPKYLEDGNDLPFIVVAPQCPAVEHRWMHYLEDVIRVLDEVTAGYAVDLSRVYLTGLSMGGQGTWFLACEYPDRFAAIAPICGRTVGIGDTHEERRQMAQALKEMPIWVFHGDADDRVPVEQSRSMVKALQTVSANVTYTEYAGVGHNAWTLTYDNPALYEWFLSYRKS